MSEINTQLDDLAGTVCGGIHEADRVLVAACLHDMRDNICQELRNAPAEPAEPQAKFA
jgi:hypothetical protein